MLCCFDTGTHQLLFWSGTNGAQKRACLQEGIQAPRPVKLLTAEQWTLVNLRGEHELQHESSTTHVQVPSLLPDSSDDNEREDSAKKVQHFDEPNQVGPAVQPTLCWACGKVVSCPSLPKGRAFPKDLYEAVRGQYPAPLESDSPRLCSGHYAKVLKSMKQVNEELWGGP